MGITFSCLNMVLIIMQANKQPYRAARCDFQPKWDLLSSSWELEARQDILCGWKRINQIEFLQTWCCLQSCQVVPLFSMVRSQLSTVSMAGLTSTRERWTNWRVLGEATKKGKGLKHLCYEEKQNVGQLSLEKSQGESHLLHCLYWPNAILQRLLL